MLLCIEYGIFENRSLFLSLRKDLLVLNKI